MVYLSANGEVIGQFDEGELPSVMAAGKVPPESFFWREGMPDWRPLRELVLPPRPRQAAVPGKLKLGPRPAGAEPVKREVPAAKPATERGAPREIAPALAKRKIFTPRAAAPVEDPAPAVVPTFAPEEDPAPAVVPASAPAPRPLPAKAAPAAVKKPVKRGRKSLLFLALLPLLGALGAAAWWFFPVEPPSLQGEVRLPAADGQLAPAAGADVLLVSQQELVAQWRGLLDQAQSRAAELEPLLQEAKAAHREKVLVLELAARTSELADEYNMPDAAELRAARDAAQTEEAAALAEVEKLNREKEAASAATNVLRQLPEAIDRTETDETGAFRLLLPPNTEGLVAFVVAGAESDDPAALKAWLVPLGGEDLAAESARLSANNALDADQIKEIAGAQP